MNTRLEALRSKCKHLLLAHVDLYPEWHRAVNILTMGDNSTYFVFPAKELLPLEVVGSDLIIYIPEKGKTDQQLPRLQFRDGDIHLINITNFLRAALRGINGDLIDVGHLEELKGKENPNDIFVNNLWQLLCSK